MARSNVKAIEAARQRRAIAIQARLDRWEKKVTPILAEVKFSMMERVSLAVDHVRKRVVENISRPVTKIAGKRSGRIRSTNRSKPGEFPKADTTLLLKTIFGDVSEIEQNVFEGRIGTTLDYGMILETSESLDRKFLTKTLFEERDTLRTILTGGIGGSLNIVRTES